MGMGMGVKMEAKGWSWAVYAPYFEAVQGQ
jgi:hypothetical protein